MLRANALFYICLCLEMLLQCSKTLPIPSGSLLSLFTLKNNHASVHYSRDKRQMRRNNYDEDEDDWYVFDTVEETPNRRNDTGQFNPNNNVQFGAQRPWLRPSTPLAPTTRFIPAFPNAGPPKSSRCEEDCNRRTATSQYNPVCGSNSVTYINLGKLNCAALCGTNVSLRLTGRCAPIFPPM